MKRVIITSLAISIGLFSAIAEAKIYKWKDAEGQVHYTSTPPKPTEKNVDLKKDFSFSTKISTESVHKVDKKEDKPKDTNEKSQKTSNTKLKFCNKEQKNLDILTKNSTVTWIESGKETPLSGKLLEDKILAITKSIQTNCSSSVEKNKE